MDTERCKGCGLCVAACPLQVLALTTKNVNQKGYNYDDLGFRVKAYTDEDNMKSKIKTISTEHRTPYILVVGQKEKDENSVCVRYRFSSGKQQQTMKVDDFIAYITKNVADKSVEI